MRIYFVRIVRIMLTILTAQVNSPQELVEGTSRNDFESYLALECTFFLENNYRFHFLDEILVNCTDLNFRP